MSRVTKFGRFARGTADGAGAGGRVTGTQTPGGGVGAGGGVGGVGGGVGVRSPLRPDITPGTGPCAVGVAVRRQVLFSGLYVNAAHVGSSPHAAQHAAVLVAVTCLMRLDWTTRPVSLISE